MWMGTKSFTQNDKYNYSDLNRENTNIQYLIDTLTALGYAFSVSPLRVDYIRTDFLHVSDINATKNALNNIKQNFYYLHAPDIVADPSRIQAFDYNDANDLELNAQDIYDVYNNVVKALKYCGTFSCGEDVI